MIRSLLGTWSFILINSFSCAFAYAENCERLQPINVQVCVGEHVLDRASVPSSIPIPDEQSLANDLHTRNYYVHGFVTQIDVDAGIVYVRNPSRKSNNSVMDLLGYTPENLARTFAMNRYDEKGEAKIFGNFIGKFVGHLPSVQVQAGDSWGEDAIIFDLARGSETHPGYLITSKGLVNLLSDGLGGLPVR